MAAPTKTGTGVGHPPPSGGNFPPLDTSTFVPQLIWLAISFGLLYLLMSRIALPRIGQVIEERRERIQRDLDAAERLKGETEQALAAYEQALAQARAKAHGIASGERERLAADGERERQRVEQQLAAQLADADKRIAATKTKALAQINEVAADTAGAVVKALIGADVSR
ncbi:MAG: F0F1 ATP synthase subunit B, partial [Hyphomicrobiaceae bacterium]